MTAAAFNTVVLRSLTFVSVSRRVLSVPVCQTAAVRFDGLTKYDLIVFFPHLRDQSLTRIDDASKSRQTVNFSALPFHERKVSIPDFNIFVWTESLQDMLPRNSHGA